MPFVERFLNIPSGPVPVVKTHWGIRDYLTTLAIRCGPGRDEYSIAPGIYAVGEPGPRSPVLVTANYKLTFDTLRRGLKSTTAWILVLDTRGINVWCAAGKQLFSTAELVHRIKITGLERMVKHRRLVLPQLGATGVAAREVKAQSGFDVVWGPVRSRDLKRFLDNGMQAENEMRRVTFTLWERIELVPVELYLLWKTLLVTLLGVILVSGFGPGFFSLSVALQRGAMASVVIGGAVLAGAVLTPVLLPWLPGRSFALKGAWSGLATGLVAVGFYQGRASWLEAVALCLFATVVSSYLSMNFTGSTPYTSPTGVEKEMRLAIPAQALVLATALTFWVGAGFVR